MKNSRGAVLDKVAEKALCEGVTFEQRPGWKEGAAMSATEREACRAGLRCV